METTDRIEAAGMISELLQEGLRLVPPGQRIISVTEVRGSAILVTDRFVYQVSPDPRSRVGFIVHQLSPILQAP